VEDRAYRLRWRDFRTRSGRRPIKKFIDRLSSTDRAAVAAAMKEVARDGLAAARHVRGEIYEVRAVGVRAQYRVLFSQESRFILLALDSFEKTTRKTPQRAVALAEPRLHDWRDRSKSIPSSV
jgi:phage-related protein